MYDLDGRVCDVYVSQKESGIEYTNITVDLEKKSSADELKATLLDFFRATGFCDPRYFECELFELIDEAIKIFGYTK